jgi:hypothetical protein
VLKSVFQTARLTILTIKKSRVYPVKNNLSFLQICSSLGLSAALSVSVLADQVIQDDLIIVGSACLGLDCVNGESFGFDSLRIKENNLRLKFVDTSSSSSFPTRDWQITINDSANGGAEKFSIDDIDGGKTPFTIEADAPNHSLYVDDGGRIGLGTSTPAVDIHVKGGNTPTLRLEQDSSSGFTTQTWDVASNETNFFIRDATNGSTLPFKIRPGAPNSSIDIAADGDVGFGTSTPDGQFDVAHSADANNHAFLISPTSNVGVNIDNGQSPSGLFDVQTAGGVSRFNVTSDGKIGIGTSQPASDLEIQSATSHLQDTFLITNTNPDTTIFRALTLSNEGSSKLSFRNTMPSASPVEWNIHARHEDGSMRITNSENPGREFNLTPDGNLSITGNFTANGTNYASSIKLKENFAQINSEVLLNKLANLSVSKWNYTKDGDSVKHIGPFAEEFHQVFELNGDDNKTISISDISGVSLAAIKVLIEKYQEQSARISILESQLAAIK